MATVTARIFPFHLAIEQPAAANPIELVNVSQLLTLQLARSLGAVTSRYFIDGAEAPLWQKLLELIWVRPTRVSR
ncbi:MAG: hypothetical protein KME16_14890 [Scytolyngbya sp. HA4215-MV1]|nr:hypothetical protein [Scytolyngbya sp. HA4215-MV1]